MATMDEEEKKTNDREAASAFVHGDVLESIMAHVQLIDLVPACHVSRSWNRAVFFSLHRLRIKPWFLLYTQTKTPPYAVAALAYDPRSQVWMKIKTAAAIEHISAVWSSSHSTLLYALSPSRFSFSVDPLHLTWRHVVSPRIWRIDPIVAVVGGNVVVAGGVCDFEDADSLSVELLDTDSGDGWEICESMPEMLKDSATATWLSVAANSEKMYVTEKKSGKAYTFDPKTRSWTELFDLCPTCDDVCSDVYSRVIGFAGNQLIMAGITGDDEIPTGIKLWEVNEELPGKFKLIGSMPMTCLDKITGDDHWNSQPLTSITLNAAGDMIFIHNSNQAGVGEVVTAEVAEGKLCNWKSLRLHDAATQTASRLIVACSDVRFSDLKRALRQNCSLSVIP